MSSIEEILLGEASWQSKRDSAKATNQINANHKRVRKAGRGTFYQVGYDAYCKENGKKEKAQKNYDEYKKIGPDAANFGRGALDAAKDIETRNKAERRMKIHGESAFIDIEFK